MRRLGRARICSSFACGLCLVALLCAAYAQPPAGRVDTRSPRERALIDLTGQWVSVVNEDWLWRMVTPPAGDTASIPLNTAGRAAALAWDLERDIAENRQCQAYGPPGLIRRPTRLRVRWEGEDTLRLDFDAGNQTRRLHFDTSTPPEQRSLQGYSVASWYRQPQSRGVFAAASGDPGGALHVQTTNMTSGYLRPNGVPYSERATVKEYFNTFTLPGDGGTWLIVTTVVNDPEYLTTELLMSTQFKKEPERRGWNPQPCEIPPPLIDEPLYTPDIFG